MVSDLSVGSELLGYRVERVVGRGGMSVVYLAEDLRLKRKVALKLLAPPLAEDEPFRERFLEESELAASLDHPNVIPIYAAGEADGRLFIAMRYVEGGDLRELLREGPLSPERAVEICGHVAEALDFAHERGLVHRDVKPSNVLLDAREHVYLADFGLTKRLAEPRRVEPGLFGTIDYIAPEQIRGEQVDGRADVYSLGCVLCECLTGEPPLCRGTDAATLFAHLEEEPRSAPGLERVVPKALAKNPEDRYGTCVEFVNDAREALGLGEPPRPRWWRTPVALALSGTALIAIALGLYLAVRGGGGAPTTTSGSAVRLDAASGRVAQTVPVGNDAESIAVGSGAVWVGNLKDATVSRIDLSTSRVDPIGVNGPPVSLAVDSGMTFVAPGVPATQLTVISSTAPNPSQVVSVPSIPTGGTANVAAGGGGVWLVNENYDTAFRLDVNPAGTISPGPVARLHPLADADLNGIAVGDGSVWVIGSDLDTRLWRIDPANAHVTGVATLPVAPASVAVGDGGVWITGEIEDVLLRIDPVSLRVTARIPVGAGARAVAVGAGAVWVASEFAGTVSRVDPNTNSVVRTIRVGGSPFGVAVADGSVWVARGRT